MGCHFLLQAIFPTQGSNPGLLPSRQTLYCLSHQGRPGNGHSAHFREFQGGLRESAWKEPSPQEGSVITSYHQCHHREDHMAPSRRAWDACSSVNLGEGATELAHGSHGQGHFWPQGGTSMSPPRCHATFLCGSESEDSVPRQEGGKAGGKPSLKSLDSTQSWRPTLLELKTICSNTKGGIKERARHPAKKGRN